MIRYFDAPDVRAVAHDVVLMLGWRHVDLENVGFVRSTGSKARRTIARCHALGKAMQVGMRRKKGFYLIEVISERFDKLSVKDRQKVVIHELMHIPKTFGGGFVHHDKVHEKSVDEVYHKWIGLKNGY